MQEAIMPRPVADGRPGIEWCVADVEIQGVNMSELVWGVLTR
jgi:hypothetical protein